MPAELSVEDAKNIGVAGMAMLLMGIAAGLVQSSKYIEGVILIGTAFGLLAVRYFWKL